MNRLNRRLERWTLPVVVALLALGTGCEEEPPLATVPAEYLE